MSDAITALCCAVATWMIGIACALWQPQRASCPVGWYVNGARPSGEYSCRRAPIGDDELGPHGERDRSVQPAGEVSGRIYCTGGMRPIVVSERIVGCQR